MCEERNQNVKDLSLSAKIILTPDVTQDTVR